jgi:hypothetical protein
MSITASDRSAPTIQGRLSNLTVTPSGFSPEHSILESSTLSLKSGDSLTLTLRTKDAYKNPAPTGIPGKDAIQFFSSSVGGTGSFDTLVDRGYGIYAASFKAQKSGNVVLSAKLAEVAVGNTLPISIDPSNATHFAITGFPNPWIAGTKITVSLSALDSEENIATSYSKAVRFNSSDVKSELPSEVVFISGAVSVPVMMKTAGISNLILDDSILKSSSGDFNVISGPYSPAQSSIQIDSTTVTSNHSVVVKLLTRDAYGNLNPRDLPTPEYIQFTGSSDPGSGKFGSTQSLGNGVFTSDFLGLTAGSMVISANIANTPIGGPSNLLVLPDVASKLILTGVPSSPTAGERVTFSMTAKDTQGNLATGYNGSLILTSSDPSASFPISLKAVGGVATFSGSFQTTGPQVITLDDGSLRGVSSSIGVNPAEAYELRFTSVPTNSIAGNSISFNLNAYDQFGNRATGYGGTLQFRSSDPLASLPSSPIFTRGAGTFSVALKTAGPQKITVTDGTLSSTTLPIEILPSGFSSTQSSLIASANRVNAGDTITLKVIARDAYQNSNPSGLEGISSITLSASNAPGAGDLSALSDSGGGVFVANFKGIRAGMVSFGATLKGSAIPSAASVTVTPATADRLTLNTVPTSIISGTNSTLEVNALDRYDNLATDYSSVISVTSSDPLFNQSQFLNLSGGKGTLPFTLYTSGTSTLTLRDATLSVTTPGITVNPGPANSLVLGSIPSTVTAGTPSTFTVTAKDASGNTATGNSGSISISSTDPQATLPGTSNLVNGVGTFSITYKSSGMRTLTASDGSRTVTSIQTSVSASTFSLTESTLSPATLSLTSGTSTQVTLTLKDAFGNANPNHAPEASAINLLASSSSGTGTFGSIITQGGGVYTSNFTGNVSGNVIISAQINGQPLADSSSISVISGPPSRLLLTAAPDAAHAGMPFTPTVRALDAAGNLVTSYSSTLSFSSNDPIALLPPSFPLINGTATLPITLKTAGLRTFTVSDGSLTANSGQIRVSSSSYSLAMSSISTSALEVT